MPNPAAGIITFLILFMSINYTTYLLFTCQPIFDNISFMATSPITFLKEVQDELRKVVWPTKDEVIRLTGVVILISLIVGLFLGGADFVFTKIMEIFIK